MQEYFDLPYSSGGPNDKIVGRVNDTIDPNHDYREPLHLSAQGTVEIRITDKLPDEAFPETDTVSIDQLWIRVVP